MRPQAQLKYQSIFVTILSLTSALCNGCSTAALAPDWSLMSSAIAPPTVRPLLSSEPAPRKKTYRAPEIRPKTATKRAEPQPKFRGTLGVHLGMFREEVLATWGEPMAIRRSGDPRLGGDTADERWIYPGAEATQTGVVFFQSGRVVGWKLR